MNGWAIFTDLLAGFGVTLKLFGMTLLFSLPLGLLVSLCLFCRFKPLAWLFRGIIWVVRGTPLLLQCIVVSFVPSVVFGLKNKDVAGFFGVSVTDLQFLFVLIAFVLNYACYFAVIYEGGIKAISQGQYEAGDVLGLTRVQIFFHVVLLQVIRRITAPMSNEIITLVKDTALARVLSVAEVITVAYEKVNRYAILTPLLGAGAFYLVFSGLLTLLFRLAEKKVGYYKI